MLIQVEINGKRKHYSVRSTAKQTFLLQIEYRINHKGIIFMFIEKERRHYSRLKKKRFYFEPQCSINL